MVGGSAYLSLDRKLMCLACAVTCQQTWAGCAIKVRRHSSAVSYVMEREIVFHPFWHSV